MANKVVIKRTSVAGREPLPADIDVGELAVNLADKKIFTKDGSGTIIQLGGGSGLGDVIGPISSTDNAIARFDATTGKIIQNSTATLDDAGNLDTVSIKTEYADLDISAIAPSYVQGRTFWDSGNGTTSTYLNNDVTLQNGQEIVTLVYNGTGSTITNGSVVAVAGAQGQRPSVVLADADTESTSASTLGIATQDIPNGTEGFVTSFGFIRGIDTSTFTAGEPIYLSQTAGQFTSTRPSAPAHTVFLGWVVKVNASSGEVFVHISNGWELDELHNVLITSPTGNFTQELAFDNTAGVWKNYTKSTSTIAEGDNLYFTDDRAKNVISSNSPISYSASTGVISIDSASSTQNGYLSSTDWNTFNSKYSTGGALGTPSSGTLTNCTGYTYANLSGTVPTWNQNTTGTAVNLSTTRADWSTNGTISAVVGQLSWKNYGNNHTIFDASNSTSPQGTSVNSSNAQNAWTASYPTLMGWNGSQTYGVRVDSARVADNGISASSFSTNGYIKVGSCYIQFGSGQAIPGSNQVTVTFPIAFPNACLSVALTGSANSDTPCYVPSFNASSFVARTQAYASAYNGSTAQTARWIAIGY